MNKLEEARKKINQIDEEMIRLFEERMATVIEVAAYKRENNLPILDEAREIELRKRNIAKLTDPTLSSYYEIFFEGVLKSSKEYQKDIIK